MKLSAAIPSLLLAVAQARAATAFAAPVQAVLSGGGRSVASVAYSRWGWGAPCPCPCPGPGLPHLLGGGRIWGRASCPPVPNPLRRLRGGSAPGSRPSSTGRRSHAAEEEGEEAPYDIDSDPAMLERIREAAGGASGICGPSVRPASLGGLAYLDTSALDPVPTAGSGSTGPGPRHRVVFVLGGPGAGKGTQSDLIVAEYRCVHLSVGELLRAERAREGSPRAALIEECLVQGKIVPVEISLGLVRDAMDGALRAGGGEEYGSRIFLVDGFPRNFDNLAGWAGGMPDSAACLGCLVYDCPQDVLEARILSRAETSGRSDDNLASARKRFRTFQTETMPVVRALEEVEREQRERGEGGKGGCVRSRHVEATGTVEEVWEKTQEVMDGYVINDVVSANARLLDAVRAGSSQDYLDLCDGRMFVAAEGKEVSAGEDGKGHEDGAAAAAAPDAEEGERLFEEYERPSDPFEISNARAEMQGGTTAVVSYERNFGDEAMRETRVWSHGERGWTCIHFHRVPL